MDTDGSLVKWADRSGCENPLNDSFKKIILPLEKNRLKTGYLHQMQLTTVQFKGVLIKS